MKRTARHGLTASGVVSSIIFRNCRSSNTLTCSNADAGMREVVETKRKLGFGAEEPVTAVARHGDSPRGMNSGPDVAQLPSTAGPKRRGGGGLPAWWAREMGVLL